MEKLTESFTVVELRQLCRKLNLPVSGIKNEVSSRIYNHLARADLSKVDAFTQTDYITNPIHVSGLRAFFKRFSPKRSNPLVSSSGILAPRVKSMRTLSQRFSGVNHQFRSFKQKVYRFLKANSTVLAAVGGAIVCAACTTFLNSDVVEVVVTHRRNWFY